MEGKETFAFLLIQASLNSTVPAACHWQKLKIETPGWWKEKQVYLEWGFLSKGPHPAPSPGRFYRFTRTKEGRLSGALVKHWLGTWFLERPHSRMAEE